VFHIVANYLAVSALEMDRWNTRRLLVAMQRFLEADEVPDIGVINANEPLLRCT
jgi:hypothetical protein